VQQSESRAPDYAATATQVAGTLGNIQISGSRTTTHTTTTTHTSSDDPPAPGRCDDDFELGSMAVVNSRNDIGIKCNDYYAPTNCPTGFFVRLHKPRECVCVARCEEMVSRPAPGQSCTKDGTWTCNHYGARNGNHATFCAPVAWNLCAK
jgi:hypothetical protein